jgi:hypothetical protein
MDPSGAPSIFVRPIVCSWSASVERSQTSISMRIRLVTRYVPSRSQAGPVAHTCVRSAATSSSLRLFVPSLKPMRLRGVGCDVLVLEVRPKPSCDQRITATPRASRARFRTAWNATCGSSAHACTQRSPPQRSGSSESPANAGSSRSAGGRFCASPNRSSKSEGPSPNVTVRRDGGKPTASPVSSGGALASSLTSPAGRPEVMRAAARDQTRSRSRRSSRLVVVRSNAAKCSLSCTGVATPA